MENVEKEDKKGKFIVVGDFNRKRAKELEYQEIVTTKKCSHCREEKDLNEFRAGKGKGGRKNYCKPCDDMKAKATYQKNKTKRKAQIKAWNESNKEKLAEYTRKWREGQKKKKKD